MAFAEGRLPWTVWEGTPACKVELTAGGTIAVYCGGRPLFSPLPRSHLIYI